ncbi:hypothetical protein trd_A0694 (plasmid) [Thermomicrobium roseum DSM 5159]|uniref:Uncharacterized protein n=1 Tax=Thermomicrobium roseum (strain ATCC 27502 / DSM 5159 / P-2) TaxID=309801 RepID=B9L4I0_THERP|nr:hypothetical protein trd_A0694 [Thermomicrobium roseum DSM 5159]
MRVSPLSPARPIRVPSAPHPSPAASGRLRHLIQLARP